ncbi:TetR/AcrR family transcriptional regulator [Amycolatopsis saalfeldensis]|uniref:TetR/AcrR family transcriptional regulator n=1 Tax=Amycolatopsis saalfeldensis TaxID=394193 RepID=UPI000B8427D5|nr:TetR/AcrR family transcriptional regulator [Amycolatopsis saalfeldensis]
MTSRNAAATQQRILEQAQRQFAQYGYATITVKGVADAAGVSPNLITRYFGSKEGLFLAATRVEIPVADSFDGDRAELGTRLAASIVQRWFGAPGEDPLHRYLRDSGLDDAEARSRAAAIDAFVLGVSTRRRVLRAELGDPGDLQAWLATTIQRLADG